MTKQSDIEMVAKARAWAVKAHAGQKNKAGQDYFKAHVTVVAEGVKGDPIAEAVAFLQLSMTPRFQTYQVPFSARKSCKSSENSTPVLSRIFVSRSLPLIILHQKTQKSKR